MQKPITREDERQWMQESVEGLIRERVRELIDNVLEEEVEAALGVPRRDGAATGTGTSLGG